MVRSFHVDYIVGMRRDPVLITARLVRTTWDSWIRTASEHDTKVKIKMPNTRVLHQYYTSQHGKVVTVQLRNDTIVSLHMCKLCYARYDKNTHDLCP